MPDTPVRPSQDAARPSRQPESQASRPRPETAGHISFDFPLSQHVAAIVETIIQAAFYRFHRMRSPWSRRLRPTPYP